MKTVSTIAGIFGLIIGFVMLFVSVPAYGVITSMLSLILIQLADNHNDKTK